MADRNTILFVFCFPEVVSVIRVFPKVVRELGFKNRPFEETMRDTIEWLREEGKIPRQTADSVVKEVLIYHYQSCVG